MSTRYVNVFTKVRFLYFIFFFGKETVIIMTSFETKTYFVTLVPLPDNYRCHFLRVNRPLTNYFSPSKQTIFYINYPLQKRYRQCLTLPYFFETFWSSIKNFWTLKKVLVFCTQPTLERDVSLESSKKIAFFRKRGSRTLVTQCTREDTRPVRRVIG